MRIKKLRAERDLTQDALADLAGLNRVHLYRIEKGTQSVTLRTLQTLAIALNVGIEDLVKDL